MIDRKNVFDQFVKNDIRAYDNIRQISTGQGDDYTTGFLLDYNYFKEHYNIIAIDLISKKNWISIQMQYSKLVLLET